MHYRSSRNFEIIDDKISAITHEGHNSYIFCLESYRNRFIYFRNVNAINFDDDILNITLGKPIVLRIWKKIFNDDVIFVNSVNELVQAVRVSVTVLSSDGTKKIISYNQPENVVDIVDTLINNTKDDKVKKYLEDQVSRSCAYCGKYWRFVHCKKCMEIICDTCDKKT
jgi:hypothetical protein